MSDENRRLASFLSVAISVCMALAIVGFGELRLRSYVDYPWLKDRQQVMDQLTEIRSQQKHAYNTFKITEVRGDIRDIKKALDEIKEGR